MEILKNVNLYYAENAKDKVGISISGDKVQIVVPKTFKVEDDEYTLKTDILLFLESISIAKKIENKKSSNSNGDGDCWPISSFVWLIRDYLENGFYYKRDKIYSQSRSGKISWKKTLRQSPIISGRNVIYDKIITYKNVSTSDIVTHIYKICLKESLEKIGWLFNYGFKIRELPIISLSEMIYIVKQELNSTYDDIKRVRFKNMLNILEKMDNNVKNKDKFQYQINNYYYVFEQMVDSLLGGITGNEKKRYNPAGFWSLLNVEEHQKASNLRPDSICKVNDETFIIDAKMYQYGCTHNSDDLPNTQSLQKQITYGEYVYNKIDKQGKVRNAFLLPYDKSLKAFVDDKHIIRYENSNLVYVGEGYVDWTDTKNKKDHERIFLFLIDFNYLLNNYDANNNILKSMVESIHDRLK